MTADQQQLAEGKRAELVERVAEADDELSELFLMEQPIDAGTLQDAIRRATLSLKFVPILMGRQARLSRSDNLPPLSPMSVHSCYPHGQAWLFNVLCHLRLAMCLLQIGCADVSC